MRTSCTALGVRPHGDWRRYVHHDRTTTPSEDRVFKQPYVDVASGRHAVRHRSAWRLHRPPPGGTTASRSTCRRRRSTSYQGRLLPCTSPVPTAKEPAQKIARRVQQGSASRSASGGLLRLRPTARRDTSTSGIRPRGPTDDHAYRASGRLPAQYSRVWRSRMYGGQRPFGYAYGWARGAYRSDRTSFENTHGGVWDGVRSLSWLGSRWRSQHVHVRIGRCGFLKAGSRKILGPPPPSSPAGSGNPLRGA
jgi:hypothetical protein